MPVIDRAFEEDISFFLAAGPVSLFCSLALGSQQIGNLDLLALVIVGLLLCFKLRTRGFVYSILLLGCSAFCKHLFFLERHLWHLGIETSIAIGFAMTSIAVEWMRAQKEGLRGQMESKESTVRHLEDDLANVRLSSQEDQIVLQERVTLLQKDLDDALSESSSLQILNEVLRKTAAQSSSFTDERADLEQRIAELLNELEEARRSISFLSDTEHQLVENERLLNELNVIRVQKEQTHLINETLARMMASLSKKTELLEKTLAQSGSTSEMLKERDQTIHFLQERMQTLVHSHSHYLQLKQQFNEKNEILHNTRAELFRSEVALESARIEETLGVPDDHFLVRDFALLEEECLSLERENRELTEMITLLSTGHFHHSGTDGAAEDMKYGLARREHSTERRSQPATCQNDENNPKSHLLFDKSGALPDKDLRQQILQGFLKSSQKALLLREFPDLAEEPKVKAKKKSSKKSKALSLSDSLSS